MVREPCPSQSPPRLCQPLPRAHARASWVKARVLTCMGDAASGWTLWKRQEPRWQGEREPKGGSETPGPAQFHQRTIRGGQGRALHHLESQFFHGSERELTTGHLKHHLCFHAHTAPPCGHGDVWKEGGGGRKPKEQGLTFSREYWQEAMTKQNWKTQISVKKPLSSSRYPRKATRLLRPTPRMFSTSPRVLERQQGQDTLIPFPASGTKAGGVGRRTGPSHKGPRLSLCPSHPSSSKYANLSLSGTRPGAPAPESCPIATLHPNLCPF